MLPDLPNRLDRADEGELRRAHGELATASKFMTEEERQDLEFGILSAVFDRRHGLSAGPLDLTTQRLAIARHVPQEN